MLDFLKLLVPIFLAPKNYYQIRQKLGAFVFYEVWIAISILRNIPSVSSYLASLERSLLPAVLVEAAAWIMRINPLGLMIALLIGLLFYIFHVHDRISDILRIRSRFDRSAIILPLAKLVGVTLTPDQEKKIRRSQDRIMRNVFYKYTSSTSENALVDKHDIEQALESWSWLWVGLEGLSIWVPAAIFALSMGANEQAVILGIIAIFYLSLIFAIRPFLARRARAQIEAIADDPTARQEVSQALDAI